MLNDLYIDVIIYICIITAFVATMWWYETKLVRLETELIELEDKYLALKDETTPLLMQQHIQKSRETNDDGW